MDDRTLDIEWDKLYQTKFGNRQTHLTFCHEYTSIKGLILEFGVFKGITINHIATLTDQEIHGFDSFKGLPEPWVHSDIKTEYPERFQIDKIPTVPNHVKLYKGWFKDTLPKWKKQHTDQIKLLHIDSDLYSSCKTILTELNEQIVPGTIIVFDELFGYKNWRDGEWKALQEWKKNYNREYRPLRRARTWAASIEVIE